MTDFQRTKKVIDWLIFQGKIKSQKELARELGYTESSMSQIINGKVPLSERFVKKLSMMGDNINENWMLTGEGDMLKGINVQKMGDVSINNSGNGVGQIGQNNGGNITITTNNGSKDKVIEQQDEQVKKSYDTLVDQLNRFHETMSSKEEYAQKQDLYIASIIKNSYIRNERNMQRIDETIRQQNEIIKMMGIQNEKTQERADRLLTLLENSLKK
jgi:hypothetical protein